MKVLAALFAVVIPLAATAQSPVLDVHVAAPRSGVPMLGFNARPCDEYLDHPWSNGAFVAALARTHPGVLRYPGGTIANDWDWVTGSPGGRAGASYPLANLKAGADAAGFLPVFCVNMKTGSLQQAIAGLAAAEALGLPVKYVEMGNEFYLGGGQALFPTGIEYGRMCQTWIEAIKRRFPGVKCAFAGTTNVSNQRRADWNRQFFSACHNWDAITLHQYWSSRVMPVSAKKGFWGTAAQQQAQLAAFRAPGGLETMLAQPNDRWNAMRAENDVPASAEIWFTEFNLTDTVGPTRQTWAHGLFLANAIDAMLRDGRVTMITPHMWFDGDEKAKTCDWGHGGMLAGLQVGAEQGDLSPWKYDLAVGGIVVRLFSEVMRGQTSAARLEFPGMPEIVPPDNRDPYAAVFGWKFGGREASAIIVNVSPEPRRIATANLRIGAHLVRQTCSDPFAYINRESKLAPVGTDTLPAILTLPPFSITQINGFAAAPTKAAGEAEIPPVSDTWISAAAPRARHGADALLSVEGGAASEARGLLQFVVKDIGSSVTGAHVRLYAAAGEGDVELHLIPNMWDEAEIDWTGRQALGPTLSRRTVAGPGWVEFDVAPVIHGPGLYSFALTSGSPRPIRFSSKEGSQVPLLAVTTTGGAPAEAAGPQWAAAWSDGRLGGTPPPPATTARYRCSEDTAVQADRPDSNLNFQPLMVVKPDSGEAFVKFSIAHLPPGAVAKATFSLFAASLHPSAAGANVSIHALTDSSWNGRALNWANRPGFGPSLIRSQPVHPGWNRFDVSQGVTGNGEYSFGIEAVAGEVSWASRESNTGYVGLCAEPTLDLVIQPADPVAEIRIDPQASSPVRLRFGYGEYVIDARPFHPFNDPAYVAAIRQSGASLLRFPGGTMANFYDWEQDDFMPATVHRLKAEDFVPRDAFPDDASYRTMVGKFHHYLDEWGGKGQVNREIRGRYGYPAFADLAAQTDADIDYVGNVSLAPDGSDPGDRLVAWMRALHAQGRTVRFLELGNELIGPKGASNSQAIPNRLYDLDRYMALAERVSRQIKRIYPGIKIAILADDLGNKIGNPCNEIDRSCRRIAGDYPSDFYDAVVIHTYLRCPDKSTEGPERRKDRLLATAKQTVLNTAGHMRDVFPGKEIWMTETGYIPGTLADENTLTGRMLTALVETDYFLGYLDNDDVLREYIKFFAIASSPPVESPSEGDHPAIKSAMYWDSAGHRVIDSPVYWGYAFAAGTARAASAKLATRVVGGGTVHFPIPSWVPARDAAGRRIPGQGKTETLDVAVDLVTAKAFLRRDGSSIDVVFLNKDPSPKRLELQVAGRRLTGTPLEMKTISGALLAQNTLEEPLRIAPRTTALPAGEPISVPGYSIGVISIPR